jgi:hypothetical protein
VKTTRRERADKRAAFDLIVGWTSLIGVPDPLVVGWAVALGLLVGINGKSISPFTYRFATMVAGIARSVDIHGYVQLKTDGFGIRKEVTESLRDIVASSITNVQCEAV